MTLDRVPLIHAPAEPERTTRFQAVYEVCAEFGIDSFEEAAHTLDRLRFAVFLVKAGQMGRGDQQ